MKPIKFMAEIELKKKLLHVTNDDICRETGISKRTLQRRFQNPESMTLGESYAIQCYLGIK